MKQILLSVLFSIFVLTAQAFTVTFRLDMNGVSGFSIPEVNGTFNSWCGSCLPMTDANGDGIWEATINLNAGTYEYKFSADNWNSQETLAQGTPCTITTGAFTNRKITVSNNVILPVVCWGSCTTCTYFPVTFQVNMNGIPGFTNPNVSGIFNNWCGNCNPMTDANGDGIWTTTINMKPGEHEFKYSYDNWVGSETLTVGSPCTKTTSGFTNRLINVSQAMTLPAYCWGTCNTSGVNGTLPTVSISQTMGSNPACLNSEVTFAANVSNAPSTPYFQWKVNGVNAGSNTSTFKTSSITNGQSITCEVTCGCNQSTPVLSNSIIMGISPMVTPSVQIAISNGATFCAGDQVTFMAIAQNGGNNPAYQWKVNGNNAGTNSNTFSSASLAANSVVTCQLTSNAECLSTAMPLTWSDEFSGSSLDATKWTPEIGAGGWGNNELQYYTGSANNVQLSGDQLHIMARNDGVGATQYTSARLITKNKFSFKYGKIVGKIKLPMGQGIWPAFWMLGANIDQVSWPGCGEIDIMEHVNNETRTHGTTHWNNNGWVYQGNFYNSDPTIFHEYSVEWDSLSIRFFVDGNPYHQHFISTANGSSEEFTKPFFILLNMAIGGNWPGNPNGTTVFPATMDVDYVRVYGQGSPTSSAISNAISVTFESNKTWFQDADGDSFGNPAITLSSCNQPVGYVANNQDCNDNSHGIITPVVGTIIGPIGVCRNASTQVFSINPVPGASSYIWTLPVGASGVSTSTSITLSFSSTYVTGNICVRAITGCGPGADYCRPVTYYSTKPATPGTISGNARGICFSETRTYSIVPVANASSYSWTPPGNSTIISGQGTNTIVLGFSNGFTTGNLSVSASNCVGNSSLRTLALTYVSSVPSSISGNAFGVCAGSTQSYTCPLVAGASSYLWTLPSNAILNSGQGTNSINVTFPIPFTSGSIQVKSITDCYSSANRSLTVTALPTAPTSISGLLNGACGGTIQTYSCPVSTTGGLTYTWSVPAGFTIESGQSSNSISLALPPAYSSGVISVIASNTCGSSTVRSATIRSVPATPGTISGSANNLCGGGNFTYSIASVSGSTAYNWTPPAGCTIISNTGTSIALSVPSTFTTGTLSVVASNACGNSVSRTLALTHLPATPGTISGPSSVCPLQSGLSFGITPLPGIGYSWTMPGTANITSGQGTSSIISNWGTIAGNVIVKASNACGFSANRTKAVALAACRNNVEDNPLEELRIYPNPGQGLYHLQLDNLIGNLDIKVFNMLGSLVFESKESDASNTIEMNLSGLPNGIYMVKTEIEGFRKVTKIVKQ